VCRTKEAHCNGALDERRDEEETLYREGTLEEVRESGEGRVSRMELE
jgi:hypothetical protein